MYQELACDLVLELNRLETCAKFEYSNFDIILFIYFGRFFGGGGLLNQLDATLRARCDRLYLVPHAHHVV